MFLQDIFTLKFAKVRYLANVSFHSGFPSIRLFPVLTGTRMIMDIFRNQLRKIKLGINPFYYRLKSHFGVFEWNYPETTVSVIWTHVLQYNNGWFDNWEAY